MKILIAFCPLMLLLFGCSGSTTPKPKEPEKLPEPATGRHAFQQMYVAARAWQPDCQVLQVQSLEIEKVKGSKGKSGAWTAKFISAAARKTRDYTFSVVETDPHIHQGVWPGPEESYYGSRGQAQPFIPAALRIDSDEAYETAAKRSADYIKANPDKPVVFLLELTRKFPDLTWRVIWGESVGTSNYSVYVDASNGLFLEKMH